jgi:hypothetical protein
MLATELGLDTVSLPGVVLLAAVLTELLKVLRMMGPDSHRIVFEAYLECPPRL